MALSLCPLSHHAVRRYWWLSVKWYDISGIMLDKCNIATLVSFTHFPWRYLPPLQLFLLTSSGGIYRRISAYNEWRYLPPLQSSDDQWGNRFSLSEYIVSISGKRILTHLQFRCLFMLTILGVNMIENRSKRWRKILYEDQGVPDNYVDESFLDEMKKNCT